MKNNSIYRLSDNETMPMRGQASPANGIHSHMPEIGVLKAHTLVLKHPIQYTLILRK